LTDFWRVGHGYAKKLEAQGLYTMGDIARCSVGGPNQYYNEDLLYKLFGVNAELLIDHAWGYEPCTLSDAKSYVPSVHSLSFSQVLHRPYTFNEALTIIKEMAETAAFSLISKNLVTDKIVLDVGYDVENVKSGNFLYGSKMEICTDRYGRKVPKHAHGTKNLNRETSSVYILSNTFADLFKEITDCNLLIRRVNLVISNVLPKSEERKAPLQINLFENAKDIEAEEEKLAKEYEKNKVILKLKQKYGDKTLLKGISYLNEATSVQRSNQIGGHRA
jgi:DNA polymerase V